MTKHLTIGIAVLGMASVATAATNVYTSEADFLAAIGDYLLEDFDQYGYGDYVDYTLDIGPMNGFSATLSASNQLFSGPGNMSTNSAGDPLMIEFTGAATNAVGGYFFAGDYDGYFVPETTYIELSNGFMYEYTPASDMEFLGFISDDVLSYASIVTDQTNGNSWATVDHLYISNSVPAPGALALLGLAGLASRRRR